MLNADKTQIIQVVHPNRAADLYPGSITIGESDIPTIEQARNLGVLFDRHLTMVPHVKQVCRTSYMHLRNIGNIRKTLTRESTEILIHAFVSSRLDYCNSLLYGLPATTVSKLQRVQNTAVRILTHTSRYDHISPVLRSLHWLPVTQRIVFKVLTLTYRAFHGQAPQYLIELLVRYAPSRALRSADTDLLQVPRSRLRTCRYLWGPEFCPRSTFTVECSAKRHSKCRLPELL